MSELKISADLGSLAAYDQFEPNPWNPNSMDEMTRAKVLASIESEGFIIPLIVRPNPTGSTTWQIIDGEHRWRLVGEAYGRVPLPYVNVGPIPDAQAKTLTVRANALRGEMDAIKLADLVAEVTTDMGRDAAEALLPYGPDKMTAMLDMARAGLSIDPSSLGTTLDAESGVTGGASRDDEFGGFDTAKSEFAHKCPRCGFGFNE